MKKLCLLLILAMALPVMGGGICPFTTIFMRTLLDDADIAAAWVTLGLGSTDGTFASNSDTLIPTEKAIKTYVTNNSSTPGGSDTHIQYNNNGDFAGDEYITRTVTDPGFLLLETEDSLLLVTDDKIILAIDAVNFNLNGIANLGDGGTTNYTNIAANGTITLVGTARVEKYMTVSAASLRRGTAPPGEDLIGTHAVLDFASNLTESAYFEVHIPPDWDVGTDLEIAIYWCPTTDDVGKHVAWEFDWEAVAIAAAAAGEILGAGSTNVEIHDDTYAGAHNLQETSYGHIAGASLAADDTIGIQLYRDHDDTDDYGADAALVHIEIEYKADKLGEAL